MRTVESLHNLNLQRCDRVTMAHGLEARVPFLDREVSRCAALAARWKLAGPGEPEKACCARRSRAGCPETAVADKAEFGDGSGPAPCSPPGPRRRRTRSPTGWVGEVPSNGWELRSEEEVLYFGIWRRHFRGVRPNATLGAFATA